MAIPPICRIEKGLTGNFRFRAKWLTKNPVLEVEVVVHISRFGIHAIDRMTTQWRDASLGDAYQIQYGVGFIQKPKAEKSEQPATDDLATKRVFC